MVLANNVAEEKASHSTFAYLSFFGLMTASPLLLLLGVLLFQIESAQRHDLQQRISLVLNSVTGDLDRDLDRDITVLRTLVTSQALANQDWRTFYGEAKAGLQGRAYLVLVDSEGRQLVNTYVPYGRQPPITGDPETVRQIAQTKAPVVSNLFVSLVVKQPVFNVSIPILEHGELRYVVSLGLLPKDLAPILSSQKLDSGWVALIWDAHGKLLFRSRENERYVGSLVPQKLREQPGVPVVRTANLDGVDVLHATARSQMSSWTVGVNVPYGVITQQMHRSLLLWSAAANLAVAVAFALGLYIARGIADSLGLAAKAALALGRGETFPIEGSRLKEAEAFLVTLRNAQQLVQKTQCQQRLLMGELQHRSKNLFSVIQAIIHRSLKDGQTAAQAEQIIMGRLSALARTNGILSGSDGNGASLEQILRGELGETYADCIDLKGCETLISADAAQQFALIFHELATNAVKYGALSNPGGRVSVSGSTNYLGGVPHFTLSWNERGGPPVKWPTRKGFGSVILFDAAKQFGMHISAVYDPHGLDYVLSMPLSCITQTLS